MTTSPMVLPRLPRIARPGFDDGWLVLAPTFLMFGVQVLLIDYLLVGPTDLGIEMFGNHKPTMPWAPAKAHLDQHGGSLALWTDDPQILVAQRWLDLGAHRVDEYHQMILLVGDTQAVQLSWSALWGCSVGKIRVTR